MAEQSGTQRPSDGILPGRLPVSRVVTGRGQSVGDEVIRGFLPRTAGCGSFARGLLTEQLRDRVDGLTLDDARLVVTELANNAFRHGHGVIELSVEIFSDLEFPRFGGHLI